MMTEGAQQTIPTDIPLHPSEVWPPHCRYMPGPPARPPGDTPGVGTAPGWRREAITDWPGASHSFNIQANPEGPRPTLPFSEPHPLGGLCLIRGLLASQASPRNSTCRSRWAVWMWRSQQEATSRRQGHGSPQPPAEFAPGSSRAAQLQPGCREWWVCLEAVVRGQWVSAA